MTTKLKLTFGNPPSTFKKEVVASIFGEDGELTQVKFDMTFKYRTRSQYGELMDEYLAKSQAPLEGDVTVKGVVDTKNSFDVEAILKMAEGWSLADPFDKDSLTRLSDTYPAVIAEITEAYRSAIMEGRIKN